MLPPLHHRLLIVVAVVVGSAPWWVWPSPLAGLNGSQTASFHFASHSPATAFCVFLIMLLPAMAASLLLAIFSGPLTGTFVLMCSLTVVLAPTAPIGALLNETPPPDAYHWLAAEAVVWLVFISAAVTMLFLLSQRYRRSRPIAVTPGSNLLFANWGSLAGLLMTCVFGAVIVELLGTSMANKQMLPAIIIGFTVASLLSGMVLTRCGVLPILAAPMCVAAMAYLYVAVSYSSEQAFFAALFTRQVPGVALAMPCFYASAGTLGCTIGLGIANFAHQSVTSEGLSHETTRQLPR